MGFLETSAEYFIRGGLCMWPLLLCSLAVVFLAVERGIYYKQKISKTEFAVEFCEKMTRGQIEEAYNLAVSSVGAGLAEALITTIFGLIIAIVAMLVHAYLMGEYKKADLDLNSVADALVSCLSERQTHI